MLTAFGAVDRNLKPLGCLMLKCLPVPRTRTACSNDGYANYFAEAPSSSAYRSRREHLSASRFALAPRPPPPRRNFYTVRFKVSVVEWRGKNEASIHRSAKHFSIEGGRNRERKRRIPRIAPPPLRFVLTLRLQKRGPCITVATLTFNRFALL